MSKAIGKSAVVRFSFAAGVSALAIGLATPAFAQDSEEDENANRDIVVTAQFREQRLQDTPLSITAVDAELLEQRNQTDLAQIARQAPNVTLNAMGGAYGSSMGASIRGVGQFDFNPAYEPGVGLYIDDVYYPTLTGANFDLLDLDRVEVLRGPQGTLTGRNSIGGAIKLFSQRPNANSEGQVEVAYRSRNGFDIRGSANFALADGVYARISGVHKEQDGYVTMYDYGCLYPGNVYGMVRSTGSSDCSVAKLGEKNFSGLRASLRFEPSESIDFTVIGDYTNENHTNAAEVVTLTSAGMTDFDCGSQVRKYCTFASFTLPAGGKTGAWTPGYRTKFTGWGVSGHLNVQLSDSLQLQSITAYREYNNTWGTDDDFTPLASRGAQGYNDLDFWFVSQELRLNGSIGDNVDFTLGGFISDQRSNYYTQQDIRYIFGPALPFQFIGNDPINANSEAVFGTVILRPSEAMTLTGGLRYTNEHKDYTFHRRDYDGAAHSFPIPLFNLSPLDGRTATYNGDRLDWRLSADYRVSPEVMVYATAGTGFKGGGVTARPFDVNQALNGSFGPETVTAYEIGIKTDLLDRMLRINLSGFYNDYQDIQLPLRDCSGLGSTAPCGARQNAGDGKIKGVELEVAVNSGGFMLDGSLSYLDSHWDRISAAVGTSIALTDPIAGPKWKYSIGVQYTADFGSSGTLTPRFDLSHTGQIGAGRGIGGVFQFYPSYDIANARLTWKNEGGDLSISAELQNVFNEYYNPFRFDAVFAFSGTVYSQVGRPREAALVVRKTF